MTTLNEIKNSNPNMKLKILFACWVAMVGAIVSWGQTDEASFYDINTIQDISITFEDDNWAELLDSLRFNGNDFLLADLTINETSYEDVGVQIRESRSFAPGSKRNDLVVKLNFIKKAQNHQGIKSIHLSSALRDPSMIREVLGYEIARNYMVAPRANYAKVMMNEDYYGLFVNVEDIKPAFLEKNFGSAEGTLVECKPNIKEKAPVGCNSNSYGSLQFDKSSKCYLRNFRLLSEEGWDDLIELTRVLAEEPAKVNTVLDVDRTLWMLAFNNVIANLNSYTGQYANNYFLYKDEEGKFHPIVWNLNLSFGSFKNTGFGSDLTLEELQTLDPLLHEENSMRPLISQLLSNDEYKKIYLSHMRTIVYDYFSNEKYIDRANELQSLIEASFMEDRNKRYTADDFKKSLDTTIGMRSKIPGIVELMEARTGFLKKNRALSVIPPEIGAIMVMKREKFSSQSVKDFKIQVKVGKFAKQVHIYYRFDETGNFMKASMNDDGASFDGEANDEVYGLAIDPTGKGAELEYYIVAENAKAISYDPPNYMFNRHKTSLAELNR